MHQTLGAYTPVLTDRCQHQGRRAWATAQWSTRRLGDCHNKNHCYIYKLTHVRQWQKNESLHSYLTLTWHRSNRCYVQVYEIDHDTTSIKQNYVTPRFLFQPECVDIWGLTSPVTSHEQLSHSIKTLLSWALEITCLNIWEPFP